MIKTPLSTVIGGAFWTPSCTVIGGNTPTFDQQIQKLFANGEQGFFYDPNDLSTMYQDAVGTVPVTSVGQPVGLIRDKSGRNNHAYQTVSASRPILRQNAITSAYYLEFDGTDDFLQTNNIDFTATDKVSLFAGVRKLSDAAQGILCELSTSVFESNNSGAFAVLAPGTATLTTFRPYSRGTVLANTNAVPTAPAPNSFVGTAKMAISIPKIDVRVDGVDRVFTNMDQGTGTYGNHPLYIGRRGGTINPFNGRIYGLIGIGKLTTDGETLVIEKELAKRTGVSLNV